MSQRESGYQRVERDTYETPEWVTLALLPHLGNIEAVWEPACGSGKMLRVLQSRYADAFGTDISTGDDFLTTRNRVVDVPRPGIITNPPYNAATEFVERALKITGVASGIVAMLLRTDFDHAKTRSHLFAKHPAFSKKIVLTKRVVWFEKKGAAPSFNHAWYIWDWKHSGPPTLSYDLQTN